MLKDRVAKAGLRIRATLIAIFLAAVPTMASADAYLEAIPTSWRLQNYMPGGVFIFFAGTPCTYGSLSFPSSATDDDIKRLWSLVISANTAGKVVGVTYETASGSCQITSFLLKEQ